MKKIAMGSDHAGYVMKEELKSLLTKVNIEVIDCGPDTDEAPALYVNHAEAVAKLVSQGAADGGILICGTGIGMSIAANKLPGIRAGLCNEIFTAKYSKSDVNINVLCLGARVISQRLAEEITQLWIHTPFTGGRFAERLQDLSKMEEKYLR